MKVNLNLNNSLLQMLKGLKDEDINKIIADSVITDDELDTLTNINNIDTTIVLCAKALAENSTDDATQNNKLCASLEDFFSNEKVQKVIDADGNGTIETRELTDYLDDINGFDNNKGILTLADIQKAFNEITGTRSGGDKTLKEKLDQAGANLNEAWSALASGESEMNDAVSKEMANNQDLAQYQDAYNEQNGKIKDANTGITDTTDKIDKKNTDIETKNGEIDTIKTQLQDNQTQQISLTKEMDTISGEIDGLNSNISDIQGEADRIDPTTGEVIDTNKSGRIADIQKEVDAKVDENKSKKDDLDALVISQQDLELKQRIEKFNLDVLNSELQDLEKERDDFIETRDKTTEERDKILKNIQECKSVSKETKAAISNYHKLQSAYNSAKTTYDSAKAKYNASIDMTYLVPEKRKYETDQTVA